ncbi:MAG: PTS sugar transporter subunit IIA [Elusimicrobiota bacterium]
MSVLSVEELITNLKYSKESPLRVYLGAAAGVGKTYRMLQDGNLLLSRGVDVVIGYIEPHRRPETSAQIGALKDVPRRKIGYKGVAMEEMDLEAVLARKPQVVLVDELAHTNAPGSKNAKRWQDVENLLAAGIAVFTTVNVQHIESVSDVVEKATGVIVQERVPDAFFRLAKEMVIVDVSVEELLSRLKDGKIYALDKVDRALERFFTRGNLSTLRELALRELADDVEQKGKEDRERDTRAGLESTVKIVVALSSNPDAKKLLRVSSRLAGRRNAKWFAVSVKAPDARVGDPDHERNLQENARFARELGAQVVELRGARVADALIGFASQEGATEVIIGTSARGWWDRLWHGSIAEQILHKAPHLALHVLPIAHEVEDHRPAKPAAPAALQLAEYLAPERILVDVRASAGVESAIALLVDRLVDVNPDLRARRREILEAVLQRERLDSTFLDTGIAIPHAASVEGIVDIQAALGLFPDGIVSERAGRSARLVLLFLSPSVGRSLHMKFLQRIARVFGDATVVRELAALKTGEDVRERLREIESRLR